MKFRAALLALVLLATPAIAQQAVQQSGSVTRGHVPYWVSSGVIGDGGSATNSPVSSIGVTNNGGAGICVSSDVQTAAGRNQLCFGASTTGAATISLQNYGTAAAQSLQFIINGAAQGFPTVSPLPVVVGDSVCFSTVGGGLKDCGVSGTNLHLAVYTVAPSGASVSDKSRADFVGDGVNDQTAVAAAITAAGVTNSEVRMLPGVYTFGAAATVTSANNFTLEASGTVILGPTGTADTFVINGSSHSTFNLDTVVTNSTGAAIHVKGAAAAVTDTFINWGTLSGTSHQGNGLFFDATTGPMSVDYASGGQISGFNKGVVMDATGTTNFIDTIHVKAGFIFDCNTDIYGRSGTGTKNNSNVWDVNVDPFINGAVAVDIDHNFDRFDPIIWGDQAPNTATTFLLKLQSGATSNQFNGTPNIIVTFGASLISDASGNTSNTINGSSIDATSNGLSQLVRYDGSINGMLVRTGLTLGTIGSVNTIAWFSSVGVLASLATANSSILVTDGSGVPSLSTTVPAHSISGASKPTNGIYLPTTNTLGFTNNSLDTLRLLPTATAVDYATIKGAATGGGGNRVTYGADGTDTDVSIDFVAKGAGNINFNGQGSNAGGIARMATFGAGAANGFLFTSSASGGGPTLTSQDLGGTGNANIDLNLASIGTGKINANNGYTTTGAYIAKGTVPTGTTGSCVASSFVGGATAGKFSAAVCAGGTFILSALPTAPNGYNCTAQDQTTPADTLKQTANTVSSVTFTSTTAAADVVVFQCMGW